MSNLDIPNACSISASEPVGTTSLEAASCNLSFTDRFANTTDLTVTNRVGATQDSVAGIQAKGDIAVRSAVINPVGTFGVAATITNPNDAMLQTGVGYWYYTGTLPHNVLAGDTPSAPLWTPVTVNDHNVLLGRNPANGTAHNAIDINDESGDTVQSFISDQNSLNLRPKRDILQNVKQKANTDDVLGLKKYISVFGDSISHGAFALNTYNDGWVRIFQRAANSELGGNSYGAVNFLSLGSGDTATTDIHSVTFGGNGSWGTGANSNLTEMGTSLQNSASGATISIVVPRFQNNFMLNYVVTPGGGTLDVSINGVSAGAINTSGALDPFARQSFTLNDNGKGSTTILLTSTGTCEVSNISYYTGTTAGLNNFSRSGRKIIDLSDDAISRVCENSSMLVFALGHNDTASAQLTSKINTVISQCNANDLQLMVADFRWTNSPSDSVRQELVRLANSVNGAVYLPFPELFKADSSTVDANYLVNTVKTFTDGSHPNPIGHAFIAETLAKAAGFSVTSKDVALNEHDYTFPVQIPSAGTIVNIPGITSSIVKSRGYIGITIFVRAAASGAFPVGTHEIQSSWHPKFDGNGILQVGIYPAQIRTDTAVLVSTVTVTAVGQITLNVASSFVTNQSFSVMIPRG